MARVSLRRLRRGLSPCFVRVLRHRSHRNLRRPTRGRGEEGLRPSAASRPALPTRTPPGAVSDELRLCVEGHQLRVVVHGHGTVLNGDVVPVEVGVAERERLLGIFLVLPLQDNRGDLLA